MKKLLIGLSVASLFLGLDSFVFTQSNRSQENTIKYECITKDNVPVTIVTTPRGVIELIKWESTYFSASSWTPEKRCQAVTERFQAHSNSGKLRYVTYGEVNEQKVICVGERNYQPKKPYKCQKDKVINQAQTFDSVLITLQPKDYPPQVLQELFNISARANYGGITRSGREKYPTFVDLEEIFETKLNQQNPEQATTDIPPELEVE